MRFHRVRRPLGRARATVVAPAWISMRGPATWPIPAGSSAYAQTATNPGESPRASFRVAPERELRMRIEPLRRRPPARGSTPSARGRCGERALEVAAVGSLRVSGGLSRVRTAPGSLPLGHCGAGQ